MYDRVLVMEIISSGSFPFTILYSSIKHLFNLLKKTIWQSPSTPTMMRWMRRKKPWLVLVCPGRWLCPEEGNASSYSLSFFLLRWDVSLSHSARLKTNFPFKGVLTGDVQIPKSSRQQKLFNVLQIISFTNDPCTTGTTNTSGKSKEVIWWRLTTQSKESATQQ